MSYTVVFCGTPAFAIPSLEALMQSDAFTVKAVITQPDKPVGRKQIITPSPIKVCALKHGIPVLQPKNKAEILECISHIADADFLVVVAYGMILPQEILSTPKIAPVNVHPSLLPRWRGATPYQHTILNGDTEAGVSIQRMVMELDAGPILNQLSMPLDARETASSLHDTLAQLGATLLVDTLEHDLHETPQDETKATFCKKFSRTDGEVNTDTMTAEEIDRHVRALVPWPGVTCAIDGVTVKLLETSLSESKGSIAVSCAKDTVLYVQTVQEPGKNKMSGADWKQGRR